MRITNYTQGDLVDTDTSPSTSNANKRARTTPAAHHLLLQKSQEASKAILTSPSTPSC